MTKHNPVLTKKEKKVIIQRVAESIDSSNIVMTHWPLVADAIEQAILAKQAAQVDIHEKVKYGAKVYGPLLRASIDLLAAVDERHEAEGALKYTIPYGAVNALREALGATPPTTEAQVGFATKSGCSYLSATGRVCNKCGDIHATEAQVEPVMTTAWLIERGPNQQEPNHIYLCQDDKWSVNASWALKFGSKEAAEEFLYKNGYPKPSSVAIVEHGFMSEPAAPTPEAQVEHKPVQPENTHEVMRAIMEQAQVFASAWSLVGGPFDNGNAMSDAEDAKNELLQIVRSAFSNPAPTTEAQAEPVARLKPNYEALIDEYIEDYEMRGETEDGSDTGYTPNENDKALLKDAFMGFDFSTLYTTAPASSALVENAILREREECAKVCDFLECIHTEGFGKRFSNNRDLAAAIRARGRAAIEAEKKGRA